MHECILESESFWKNLVYCGFMHFQNIAMWSQASNYLLSTPQKKEKIAKASSYKFISDVLCNAIVFNLLTVIVCQSVRAKTVLVVAPQVMSKWRERMSFIKAQASWSN